MIFIRGRANSFREQEESEVSCGQVSFEGEPIDSASRRRASLVVGKFIRTRRRRWERERRA